jgi:hypothetical protein
MNKKVKQNAFPSVLKGQRLKPMSITSYAFGGMSEVKLDIQASDLAKIRKALKTSKAGLK